MSLKSSLYHSEVVRRGLQLIVSSGLFDAKPLLHIRHACYRLMFRVGKDPLISRDVWFIRPHQVRGGRVVIGDRVGINHGTEVDYSGDVIIEDDVWISQNVIIETHDHKITSRRLKKDHPMVIGSLTLGKDCWIGANVVILPCVSRIGRGSIIGAGSIVTKDIGDFQIAVGNPARVIGTRGTDEDTEHQENEGPSIFTPSDPRD